MRGSDTIVGTETTDSSGGEHDTESLLALREKLQSIFARFTLSSSVEKKEANRAGGTLSQAKVAVGTRCGSKLPFSSNLEVPHGYATTEIIDVRLMFLHFWISGSTSANAQGSNGEEVVCCICMGGGHGTVSPPFRLQPHHVPGLLRAQLCKGSEGHTALNALQCRAAS